MPSFVHETLIDLFRDRPGFTADLLGDVLDAKVPAFDKARLASADLPILKPAEYRADAVVTLDGPDGPAMAVIVEVQLSVDPAKQYTWPVYLAALRARLKCPVALLALCPDAAVARWGEAEVEMTVPPGRALFKPIVLGPDLIPRITDSEVAIANPELTVLSAVAHGGEPGAEPILDAYLTLLGAVDADHGVQYTNLVLSALPAATRAYLEDKMTISEERYIPKFAMPFLSEGEKVGIIKGQAQSVLEVLAARGIAVPEAVRSEVESCTDAGQLRVWLRRAVTIERIEELDGPAGD